jgi:hypothetical protein
MRNIHLRNHLGERSVTLSLLALVSVLTQVPNSLGQFTCYGKFPVFPRKNLIAYEKALSNLNARHNGVEVDSDDSIVHFLCSGDFHLYTRRRSRPFLTSLIFNLKLRARSATVVSNRNLLYLENFG